jgi:hypothetical protein
MEFFLGDWAEGRSVIRGVSGVGSTTVEKPTKKAALPLFLPFLNKVPANAVRPFILNLKVQGGHLPDASGASAWDAHNSITLVRNRFSKSWFKEYRP